MSTKFFRFILLVSLLSTNACEDDIPVEVDTTLLHGHTFYLGTTIPVPGVTIRFQGKSSVTDSEGVFQLQNLALGSDTLNAVKDGFDPFSEYVTVGTTAMEKVIPLTSAIYTHTLRGVVTDLIADSGLPGVVVTILNDDSTLSQLVSTSDISGSYEVHGVPEGERYVRYSKRNYQTQVVQISMGDSDQTGDAHLERNPGKPLNPSPADGARIRTSGVYLEWQVVNPDTELWVFDIYFGTENPPLTLVGTGDDLPSHFVENLQEGETYHWRIVVRDYYSGNSQTGPVWTFSRDSTTLSCPDSVAYAGRTYNTVVIGELCWFKENLDVGIFVNGYSQRALDNGIVEKYCFNNDTAGCRAYGGYYDWNEAMQYTTTPGARGICPPGWHVPTHSEYGVLVSTVDGDGNALKAVGQGSGAFAGTNTSGFSLLLAGSGNPYGWSPSGAYLWSSSETSPPWNEDYSWMLSVEDISSPHSGTYSRAGVLLSGWNSQFNVRCVAD